MTQRHAFRSAMLSALVACGALALALALAACDVDIDSVLAENEDVVLWAHDSAHVRRLVITPRDGVRLDTAMAPLLLLRSGERLTFVPSTVNIGMDSVVAGPTVRVTLTVPVNGTLRLSVCRESADGCRTISVPVYTRGRTLRGERF